MPPVRRAVASALKTHNEISRVISPGSASVSSSPKSEGSAWWIGATVSLIEIVGSGCRSRRHVAAYSYRVQKAQAILWLDIAEDRFDHDRLLRIEEVVYVRPQAVVVADNPFQGAQQVRLSGVVRAGQNGGDERNRMVALSAMLRKFCARSSTTRTSRAPTPPPVSDDSNLGTAAQEFFAGYTLIEASASRERRNHEPSMSRLADAVEDSMTAVKDHATR
jgi:hypothetical protein